MKRFRTTKCAALFAAGATIGAVVAGGIAWAAVPDSAGVIHGCYDTAGTSTSGQMRIIDTEAGAKCGKNEKALAFNQTGPQGPKGDQGIQGIQGVKGDPGISALQNVSGTTTVPANSSGFAKASCPNGKTTLSGGYAWGGSAGIVSSTFRTDDGGWQVTVFNDHDDARLITATALCAAIA